MAGMLYRLVTSYCQCVHFGLDKIKIFTPSSFICLSVVDAGGLQ